MESPGGRKRALAPEGRSQSDGGISLAGVSKGFDIGGQGRLEVLSDVSVSAPPGAFVAILGPSGSGKSTLLRLVMGLLEQDAGTVVAPPVHEIAYVFQSPNLLPWRTVIENLNIARRARARGRPTAYRRSAMHYLELVGLADYARYYPRALSGGMQQRVALARALSVEGSVLLMDEPFSSLDELTARELRWELLSLWREHRPTVLFVTHNVMESLTLASSIVVVSKRPASIIRQVDVQVPHPRRLADPAVLRLQVEIFSALGLEEPDFSG